MGVLGNILSGVAGVIPGLLNTGYNIWSNKRDFDYQKALQQQMFEREDTAVQRRVEDLKAAGLNPALANGSAASAGPVVSRSNTNDVDFGSALDMVNAVNQIKQQKQETENAKIEGQILKNENYIKNLQSKITMANTLAQLGIPFKATQIGRFPEISVIRENENKLFDTNIQKTFDYQMMNMKNNAEFIQKDLNWYIADKIYGYLAPFIPQLKFNMNQSQSTNTNTNNNRNYSDSTSHNYNYNYRR